MNDPGAHTNTAVMVGGGPSGLIAAAALAEAGVATTVLEAIWALQDGKSSPSGSSPIRAPERFG